MSSKQFYIFLKEALTHEEATLGGKVTLICGTLFGIICTLCLVGLVMLGLYITPLKHLLLATGVFTVAWLSSCLFKTFLSYDTYREENNLPRKTTNRPFIG